MDIRSYTPLRENPNIAPFRPGDTVRVHSRIVEGERERIQAFEGIVIRSRRGGANSNFTVRRISHGVGVERTFFIYSPLLEKVEVVRWGKVRRAKLYYLRSRVGKAARIKASRRWRQESAEQIAHFAQAGTTVAADEVLTDEEPEEAMAPGEETIAELAKGEVIEAASGGDSEPASDAEDATAEIEKVAVAEAEGEASEPDEAAADDVSLAEGEVNEGEDKAG